MTSVTRRYTALFLAVLVLAAALAGCGGTKETSAPGNKRKYPASMSEGYEEEYKDFSSMVHRVQSGELSIYGRIFRPAGFDSSKKYPILIMSHGYQTTGADQFNSIVKDMVANGILCYTFDFCGGSPNTRSEGRFEDMTVETEVADLKAVFNDIRQLPYVDSTKIALFGQSMGGLVTTVVVGEYYDSVSALILQAPAFTRALQDGTDPKTLLDKYEKPFLVLWGSEDESVPVDLGHSLKEQFGDRMNFVLVEGGPHSLQPSDYEKCMCDVNAYLTEMGIFR